MRRTAKAIIFWLVIAGSAFLLWQAVKTNPRDKDITEISYSNFLRQVADGRIAKVVISSNVIRGNDDKGSRFKVFGPSNQSAMLDALQQHDVDIWFDELPEATWGTWLMNLAPLILLGALWFFMIRRLGKMGKPGSSSPTAPVAGSPPDSQPRFGP